MLNNVVLIFLLIMLPVISLLPILLLILLILLLLRFKNKYQRKMRFPAPKSLWDLPQYGSPLRIRIQSVSNQSHVIGLHISNLDLETLKRMCGETGINQFVIEASQAVLEKVEGVYGWGWLDTLLTNIAQVTDKPPYFLSCRIPLWMNPAKPSWRDYIDPDHPERGMTQYPFATEMLDERIPDMLKFYDALTDQYKQVSVIILDQEINLNWWTGSYEDFARQMIISPTINVLHPKGKLVIGPGPTLMEYKKRSQRNNAREAFSTVINLTKGVIDRPSVHSYARNGRDAARQLLDFAGAVKLDLTERNLWISEAGNSEAVLDNRHWSGNQNKAERLVDGETRQLHRYQEFYGNIAFGGPEDDPTNPDFHTYGGVEQILHYLAIGDSNALFHADGTPKKAMMWLSETYLR